MLPRWCRDDATIMRAPLVERRGVRVRDWPAAVSHVVAGCSLQPASTRTDRSEPREAMATDAALFLPPGADVRAGDRVVVGGATWLVSGEPFRRESPFGDLDHVRVDLQRWEG